MSKKYIIYRKVNKVPKADGIKQLRDGSSQGDSCGTTKSGDWPLRMKGYHRALKRGESWALKLSKKSPMQFCLSWLYRPSLLRDLVYNKNPFLELISKKDCSFAGKYIPVPITFGENISFANKHEDKK